MNQTKRILVTGSNKGIGYAIVDLILQRTSYNVVMAVRSEERGQQAIKTLVEKNPGSESRLSLKLLDLLKPDEFDAFYQSLGGPVDALVNNASLLEYRDRETPEGTVNQIQANLINTIKLTEDMLTGGHINQNGKVVHVTSGWGNTSYIKDLNPEVYKRINDEVESLDLKELHQMIETFRVEATNPETRKKYPMIYQSTKMFMNAYSFIRARTQDIREKGIQMYSVTPGFCHTDMTQQLRDNGMMPSRTNYDGGEDVFYLVNLPYEFDEKYQGQHFAQKEVSSFRN